MSILFSKPLIESAELSSILGDPSLCILDCSVVGKSNGDGTYTFLSQREEWERAHIPGALYVDIPAELSDNTREVGLMMPPVDDFVTIIKKFGIGDGSAVVLYDRGNHAWAARLWWMLRVCGMDNASVLNGGLRKWQADGYLLESKNVSVPEAKTFTIRHRPELMQDKNQVKVAMNMDKSLLINALPHAVFTGEVAPYSRRGRIPGSKNLSCDAIVSPDTYCYIDLETVRLMAKDLGVFEVNKIITYCGGGIAASSVALVLTLLGLDNVTLYDGSLSEWTKDETLPMESDVG
jgi:thiosulfate/3-mercaptopyruvate sulfurtransferase